MGFNNEMSKHCNAPYEILVAENFLRTLTSKRDTKSDHWLIYPNLRHLVNNEERGISGNLKRNESSIEEDDES